MGLFSTNELWAMSKNLEEIKELLKQIEINTREKKD